MTPLRHLARVDGRTKAARLYRDTLADLIARAGIDPDDAPRLTIARRAAGLTVLCAREEAWMAGGAPMGARRSETYVRAVGALARAMRALGLAAPDPGDDDDDPTPSLAEALAAGRDDRVDAA